MKQLLLIIMTFAILSCSGGSDNEPSEAEKEKTIAEKSYIFKNDTLLVYINKGGISVFVHNKIESQCGGYFTGTYPNMIFNYSAGSTDVKLTCTFNDYAVFSATSAHSVIFGTMHNSVYYDRAITLPKQMNFKATDEILDKNADGILDSSQGI